MAISEEMKKEAFGMFDQQAGGPTFLDLLRKIQSDPALSFTERSQVVSMLRSEVGPVSTQTPLRQLLPGLGGGALGYLVAKYFSMGSVGQAISAAAGFGIGRTIANFYQASKDYLTENNQSAFQRW